MDERLLMNPSHICLIAVLLPMIAAVVVGLLRQRLGRAGAHGLTIGCVAVSFLASMTLAYLVFVQHVPTLTTTLYTWASGGEYFPFSFQLGFLIDPLTSLMMVVVTFVSLLVHIYSIGYMADDDGYERFFSYISLFTFMMLMLVTANNFLQLFFGWEGVGLVSYLLIGFWYQKESANQGSLKAFLVNRVGDFGFILGIGLIFATVGSLDYDTVFRSVSTISNQYITLFDGHTWSLVTVICLLLFVGAMGKSAQVPLHVWLPESMEGPTPISALIHAATMVTAGVFLVARMSPLMEHSPVALTFIMVIGATGALFTGLLAIVMNDIKRVIAYSTLSQLGYMMVAMGVSAYSAGIFHLLTHACFKALLFLAAGSVIIGMHHEQDMRKMGALARKMPITYFTFLIGGLALCAVPPFAGFFSKDTIIEATKLANIPGSDYAYVCVALGAMVTALYTFRAFFMTFHGTFRGSKKTFDHVKESPWVVWLPLVLLAIPSMMIGYVLYMPMLFDAPTLLSPSLVVLPENNVLATLSHHVSSPMHAILEAPTSIVFWLTMSGIALSWLAYVAFPSLPGKLVTVFKYPYQVLLNKYGVDGFYQLLFVNGTRGLGRMLYRVGDRVLIDGFFVNGTGAVVRFFASKGHGIQSGYLYHYIVAMVLGLGVFLCWLLLW